MKNEVAKPIVAGNDFYVAKQVEFERIDGLTRSLVKPKCVTPDTSAAVLNEKSEGLPAREGASIDTRRGMLMAAPQAL